MRHATARWFAIGTLAVGLAGPAAPGQPANAEPFARTPRELLELSASVPERTEAGTVLLLRDVHYELDTESRTRSRSHVIYRIDAASALPEWSEVHFSWNPWHQEQPEVHARVVTPDGRERTLDPATLRSYSAGYMGNGLGDNVFGEVQVLSGPLPGVELGAIVEIELRSDEREPLFDGETNRRFDFTLALPVQQTRLVIDAPATLPLHIVQRKLPDHEFRREERDGRVSLVFEAGPQPAWKVESTYAPPDVPRIPYVGFSTGESWNAVASRYAAVVEEQIGSDSLASTVRRVIGKTKERETILPELLAFLHDKVRYTGVEFGSQAVVPATPRETLRRGFGDCKDKATLLVTMLREAGIEASVALVLTGPGRDVDPELPGLGQFDHAIVFVPGATPVWIDATAEFARLGEIPLSIQGRQALVADPATRKLRAIPAGAPSSNRIVETREVYLQPEGGARIVETTEWHGHFEQLNRAIHERVPRQELEEGLEDYAENTYETREVVDFNRSGIHDLSSPFRMTLEIESAGVAWTAAPYASVVIPLGALAGNLPAEFQPMADEAGFPSERSSTAPATASSNAGTDVLLPLPHVYEWEYRLHAPPGYVLHDKPDNQIRRFGAATLTEEYAPSDDGTIVARYRFESGTRHGHHEADALRKGLGEFYAEPAAVLQLVQLGEIHLAEGRIGEALDEFRRMVDLYPDQASYRSQYARGLLAAGFGGPARAEASAAVELQPGSAVAQRTLGVVLAHDLLGRKYRHGFDHESAESALRKAIELDPEDVEARSELAALLRYDADGLYHSAGSRVDEAVAEYRKIRDDLEVEWHDDDLMLCLLYLGRFEEVEEIARESRGSSYAGTLLVTAIAALRGADEARTEASRLAGRGDAYSETLVAASQLLTPLRRYQAAAELLDAAAKGHPNAMALLAQADALRTTYPQDLSALEPDSPETLVRKYFYVAFSGSDSELWDLFAPAVVERLTDEESVYQARQWLERLRHSIHDQGGSMQMISDIALSHIHTRVEGTDETGYRVEVNLPGLPADQMQQQRGFIVRQGDEYRLVDLGDFPAALAIQVLEWVEDDRLVAAAQWLDWVREALPALRNEDPLSLHPMLQLWGPGLDRGREAVRHAAAALMAHTPLADEAIKILAPAREAADPAARTELNAALLPAAIQSERFELAEEIARAILEEHPSSDPAFFALTLSLARLDRAEEADELIQARLADDPRNPLTLNAHAALAQFADDLLEWRNRLLRIAELGLAGPFEYNNLAWAEIAIGEVTDKTLQSAQRAAMSGGDEASLHTLATVYAEMDRPEEARDILLTAVAQRAGDNLIGHDWYVLGRIAESYGLGEVARDAYGLVEASEDDEAHPSTSTHGLAQRRLAELRSADGG